MATARCSCGPSPRRRGTHQECLPPVDPGVAKRLTKAAARELISALVGSRRSALFTVVVLVQLRRVRVAQRGQAAANRGRGGEAVAAEHVEVLVLERGEPRDALDRPRPRPIASAMAWGGTPSSATPCGTDPR